jgi:hypothetical protein
VNIARATLAKVEVLTLSNQPRRELLENPREKLIGSLIKQFGRGLQPNDFIRTRREQLLTPLVKGRQPRRRMLRPKQRVGMRIKRKHDDLACMGPRKAAARRHQGPVAEVNAVEVADGEGVDVHSRE